jgi:hypothetical protein
VALRVLRGGTLFYKPQRAQRCTEFFPPWLSAFFVVKLFFLNHRGHRGSPWLSVFSEVKLFFLYHKGHRGAVRIFSVALRVLRGEKLFLNHRGHRGSLWLSVFSVVELFF